jgi:plasmid stabilization system protein ParE
MAFDPTKPFSAVSAFDPGRPFKKASPGAKGEAVGALSTLTRSIPFLDEVNDAVFALGQTVVDRAMNPNARTTGKRAAADYKARYDKAQARTRDNAGDFQDRRPIAADLVKGGGLALQAAPALLTGGTTAAPAVASAVPKGLIGSTARLVKPMADSAVSAGLSAQIAGLGGDGSVQERVKAANDATIPAMAIGAAIPPAIAVLSKARRMATDAASAGGRTAARVANRASGGTMLDPNREAALRLGEALKSDGLSPDDVRRALVEWQQSGASSPALLDLAGENTRALLRSAGSKPGAARNLAVRYARQVGADLQDNAISRTSQLVDDARTLPAIEDDIAGRIRTASAVDEAPAGSGGMAVAEALNQRRDVAAQAVDDAYNAARGASPEGAHLRAGDMPQVAANIREAVRDFHPDDIPSVARELSTLDSLSTPTVRDLFEMRQRLTSVRMSKPDQAAAAARAVRALDDEIGSAVERGAVTGDPEVVGLWRNAIAQRRQFGQTFEGDDLLARLTGRERHGEGIARAVAPEDASGAILGRNGVAPRPNVTRDLARIRDELGADSAEWGALQREATSRLLGRDAGSEDFGAAWLAFERQNPQLAELLMPAGQREALNASREGIGGAVADRAAVGTGRGVLSASPDQFSAEVAAAGERQPLARVGAVREIEDQIGRPREGATGLLNRLSTATNTGRNLEELFGPEEAARYRDAIEREVQRVNNARFVNPNDGSQSAPRLMDDALVDLPPMSKLGILRAIVDKIRRGASLTDAEREALMQLGTTRLAGEGDVPSIPLLDGARRLLTPAQRQRLSRLLSSAQGAQRGAQPSGSVP